ncbi:MAG: type II secretion system minor pseudopilin GspH [Thiotrichaceae bacterium]|nr:type II secretion system minor pseudopilin GspH [Thiotrichaceae bacterium]
MKNKTQGFTLIEIMVVIAIAAIMIGAAVLAFPDSSNDRLKEQGGRFSALISLAQDEAILQSQDLAVAINDSGYSFYRRESSVWVVYSDKPFVARVVDGGIQAEVVLEGVSIKLPSLKKAKPQIVIYSNGEMTPFSYNLSNQEKSKYTIQFDGGGNLKQEFIINEKI